MPNKDQKKNKRSIVMFGYKNIIKIKYPMEPKQVNILNIKNQYIPYKLPTK